MQLLTVCEAGAQLRVSRSTIYELIGSGDLPSVRIRRSRRIPADAVDALIAKAS